MVVLRTTRPARAFRARDGRRPVPRGKAAGARARERGDAGSGVGRSLAYACAAESDMFVLNGLPIAENWRRLAG